MTILKILTKQDVVKTLKWNYARIDKFTYIIFGFVGLVWLFGGAIAIPYIAIRDAKFFMIIVAAIIFLLGVFVWHSLIEGYKKAQSNLQKIQNEQFYLTVSKIIDIKEDSDEGGRWFMLIFDNNAEVVDKRKVCSQIGEKFYFVYLEGEKMPSDNCYNKSDYILSADLQEKLIDFKR